MVAHLPDIYIERARALVALDQRRDALGFEIAADEQRGSAEFDPQHDAVVVRVGEGFAGPTGGRGIEAAPKDRELGITVVAGDGIDDVAGDATGTDLGGVGDFEARVRHRPLFEPALQARAGAGGQAVGDHALDRVLPDH